MKNFMVYPKWDSNSNPLFYGLDAVTTRPPPLGWNVHVMAACCASHCKCSMQYRCVTFRVLCRAIVRFHVLVEHMQLEKGSCLIFLNFKMNKHRTCYRMCSANEVHKTAQKADLFCTQRLHYTLCNAIPVSPSISFSEARMCYKKWQKLRKLDAILHAYVKNGIELPYVHEHIYHRTPALPLHIIMCNCLFCTFKVTTYSRTICELYFGKHE